MKNRRVDAGLQLTPARRQNPRHVRGYRGRRVATLLCLFCDLGSVTSSVRCKGPDSKKKRFNTVLFAVVVCIHRVACTTVLLIVILHAFLRLDGDRTGPLLVLYRLLDLIQSHWV